MPDDATGLSLLEDIDARQNQLLDELDLLNLRIERLITETAAWRGTLEAPVKLPAAA
jgi:hypothetical protein